MNEVGLIEDYNIRALIVTEPNEKRETMFLPSDTT